MKLEKIPLGPLGTNCYVVHNDKQAIIFDPGGESGKLIDLINEKNLKPIAVCLTHAHFDHIGAVDDIKNYYNIEVYVHKNEQEWLTDANLNGSALFMGGGITTSAAEHYLKNGQMTLGSFRFEVRHVPGHSPGGVIFIFHDENFVIGGDSLFHNGIGRTDLPGGNMEQLLKSIKKQMFTLRNDYIVHPGHGKETTIEYEKKNNTFLK
ncbi:MBL fold metallo-hydrolase [Aquibacillus rhizosphaerae]|uniref:MBL fold metallo-hydrolase n=1 Tax=Aquibacillus rhizosphaerae TaxID=3051431 RepID=A0ABT7L8L7_9BACI|nr:MBL fold metallo-hydrolase [Aquibacillus sp. LR5S19]MDL4841552.1 MBL fold metallo-hydrolase [Aquibacillus sp. LR5S19]